MGRYTSIDRVKSVLGGRIDGDLKLGSASPRLPDLSRIINSAEARVEAQLAKRYVVPLSLQNARTTELIAQIVDAYAVLQILKETRSMAQIEPARLYSGVSEAKELLKQIVELEVVLPCEELVEEALQTPGAGRIIQDCSEFDCCESHGIFEL